MTIVAIIWDILQDERKLRLVQLRQTGISLELEQHIIAPAFRHLDVPFEAKVNA